ncbi:unnamed protein product [Rangifer tarandus platyrhynchus]|uniref:Uncharacterized protein n=2 Tax=Rangifer tarandus platyrhynchus TaxID=3082113 RepID=A0ACB0DZX7_RANTA|nr:unnamed protein product [Rangifer tarandus platyrhynchus]CAI9693895.1 unnamed protein product [Rangifer tarandus platyrhynchus]
MTCLFLWLPRRPQTRKAQGLSSQWLSDLSTALRDVTRDDRTNAAARPLADPLVPGLGGAPGKHVQPPARRQRPWTRACRPLRGCSGGQREAPGPRGSRARSGARLTSASCRAALASRPQPAVQTLGRGVRRPSPAATRLGPLNPQPPPRQSASRASSTTAAAVVAALPPGGADTWEGGAAAPGARPPDPGLGALTSARLRNPLCRPSPGTPSRPAGSDFARSSWFYAEGKGEGCLHTRPSLRSPRRSSGIFLKARPEGLERS